MINWAEKLRNFSADDATLNLQLIFIGTLLGKLGQENSLKIIALRYLYSLKTTGMPITVRGKKNHHKFLNTPSKDFSRQPIAQQSRVNDSSQGL